METEFDLIQTLSINLEMINTISNGMKSLISKKKEKKETIESTIKKINSKLTLKKKLFHIKNDLKTKLLISKQIKAAFMRNNNEIISKYTKQINNYESCLSDKSNIITGLLKKFKEYEIYIMREVEKQKLKKHKNFSFSNFIDLNFYYYQQRKTLLSNIQSKKEQSKEKLTNSIIRALNKSTGSSNNQVKKSNNNSLVIPKINDNKEKKVKKDGKIKEIKKPINNSAKPKKKKLFSYFKRNKSNTMKRGFFSKILFYNTKKNKQSPNPSFVSKKFYEETKFTSNEISTAISRNLYYSSKDFRENINYSNFNRNTDELNLYYKESSVSSNKDITVINESKEEADDKSSNI